LRTLTRHSDKKGTFETLSNESFKVPFPGLKTALFTKLFFAGLQNPEGVLERGLAKNAKNLSSF
jgi:hypothetical protein